MKKYLLWFAVIAMIAHILADYMQNTTWINDVNDNKWHNGTCFSSFIVELQNSQRYEFGFRKDGTVVWRKAQSATAEK